MLLIKRKFGLKNSVLFKNKKSFHNAIRKFGHANFYFSSNYKYFHSLVKPKENNNQDVKFIQTKFY